MRLTIIAITLFSVGCQTAEMKQYQCRSKQSEAKANLKGGWLAQKAFIEEFMKPATSHKEVRFDPEAHRRYTYCMVGECIACDQGGPCADLANAKKLCADALAKHPAAKGANASGCAIGSLNGPESKGFDIWVVGGDGLSVNVLNACQAD
jgi:hypothetical protein